MTTKSHQEASSSIERSTSHICRAQEIINRLRYSATLKEYSEIERFLFRIILPVANQEGWTREQRNDTCYSFFQCRSLLKIVFDCDADSIISIEKSLKNIWDVIGHHSIAEALPRIRRDFRSALDCYFESDFFGGDPERCEMIVLFDQEWESFLTEIGPVLIDFDPAAATFEEQPGDFMDLRNPS